MTLSVVVKNEKLAYSTQNIKNISGCSKGLISDSTNRKTYRITKYETQAYEFQNQT